MTVGLTADRTQSNTLRQQSIERRAKVYSDFLLNVTAFQVSVAHCEEPLNQKREADPGACDKARSDFTQAAGTAWAVDFASYGSDVRDARKEIAAKMNTAYVNVEAVYSKVPGVNLNDGIFQTLDSDLKDLKEKFAGAAREDLTRGD
ncbi:hypothetical protein [Sinomonas flava]|uniref:hypothetical protein n=1 Tax=Sinomonas flava TaxID=496857 RepID=UPI0039A588DD